MLRPFAATVLAISLLAGGIVWAQSGWRQIGVLQSESRNLSIGKGTARVVSAVQFRELYGSTMMELDTLKVQEMYPGWDKRSDIVMMFEMSDDGFRQTDWWFGQNEEKVPLEGDTISTSLGIFDRDGKRRANIPDDLKAKLGDKASVVAAVSGNLDQDDDAELAIVVAGPWDAEERGALNNVSLFDRTGGSWQLIGVFELEGLRRAGAIEIRDVTMDGKPDVIYRSFREVTGRFYVDAHIFSTHDGVPESNTPLEFDLRAKKPESKP